MQQFAGSLADVRRDPLPSPPKQTIPATPVPAPAPRSAAAPDVRTVNGTANDVEVSNINGKYRNFASRLDNKIT